MISDSLHVFDLRWKTIDLSSIGNRRFMYHPDGWLILGAEDSVSGKLLKSHAEEYHEATQLQSNLPSFDSFIRGWVGIGGSYKSGIIHFAPCIPAENIEMFDKAFSFIEAALQNGFTPKCILRGFPGAWEQSIKKAIPGIKAPISQQISNAKSSVPTIARKKDIYEKCR